MCPQGRPRGQGRPRELHFWQIFYVKCFSYYLNYNVTHIELNKLQLTFKHIKRGERCYCID